jgi:hypothetical protein
MALLAEPRMLFICTLVGEKLATAIVSCGTPLQFFYAELSMLAELTPMLELNDCRGCSCPFMAVSAKKTIQCIESAIGS